jgi:hypothetical protein
LLCVPVALVYDLLLTGVAIAWLSGAGRERGFLPGEKAALVFCFLAPLFTWQCGRSLHVSLGLISAAVLVALCVARQLRAAQTASHPLMARQTIGTPHDT